MSELGQFIKEKREIRGMAQKALGKACGMSDSAIQRIESGERKTVKWDTLCKIACALEFHPFEFLLVAGYIKPEDLNPNIKIHGLESLSEAEIETVQTFVDFLKSRNLREKGGL